MNIVIAYLSTAIVFAVLDAIWLTAMIDRLYRPTLGDILLPTYNLPAAAVFYLIYVLGIVVLAVLPAVPTGKVSVALLNGALVGFFAYATYDLTNQSTLRNWTWTLSIADIAWGTFVTAIAATAGFAAVRAFGHAAG